MTPQILCDIYRHTSRLLRAGSSLPPVQAAVLRWLAERGDRKTGVHHVREAFGLAQSTASEIVSRLAQGGYVTKERDTADARHLRIEITAKGRQALRTYEKALLERLSEAMEGFTEEERRDLDASLGVVREGLAVAGREAA